MVPYVLHTGYHIHHQYHTIHTTIYTSPHQAQAIPTTSSRCSTGTLLVHHQSRQVVSTKGLKQYVSRYPDTLCTTSYVPYTPLCIHHQQYYVYLYTLGLGYTYQQQQVQYWYCTGTVQVQIQGSYEGFEVVSEVPEHLTGGLYLWIGTSCPTN